MDEAVERNIPLLRDIRIKIIGAGGAGLKTMSRIMSWGFADCEYTAIDCNAMSLSISEASLKILIGEGGGTTGDMVLGEYYASEKQKDIYHAIRGNDVIIVTCGLGGGTGGAIAPMVLSAAKQTGALAVAVVTSPVRSSDEKIIKNAKKAFKNIKNLADAYIVIPNDYGESNGLSNHYSESIFLADKEIDEAILAVRSLVKLEWEYAAKNQEEVLFYLTKANGAAVYSCIDTSDEIYKRISSAFLQPPLCNIKQGYFSSMDFYIKCSDKNIIFKIEKMIKDYMIELFQEDIITEFKTVDGSEMATANVEIIIAVKGFARNPYYPMENNMTTV